MEYPRIGLMRLVGLPYPVDMLEAVQHEGLKTPSLSEGRRIVVSNISPVMENATPKERARAYLQANASVALEGLHLTSDDLALQQKVIDGEWTSEELRAHLIANAQAQNAAKIPQRAAYSFGDLYCISGTNVLENKLGIADEKVLDGYEAGITANRLADLFIKPLDGGFDLTHLQRIHCAIFQDVYEWAGQLRRVNITKGLTLFAKTDHLHSSASEIFSKLAQEKDLQAASHEYFAKSAASYFADVNALHPFREGNGRAQREFFRELALKSGYTIDWSITNKKKMLTASIEGVCGNNKPFEKILRQAIAGDVNPPFEWIKRKFNRF